MNYRMLGYLLSIVLLIEAALLLLPMGVALIYGESPLPFIFTIALLIAVALPSVIMKPKNTRIFAKEGFGMYRENGQISGNMAKPRKEELAAAISRCRGLIWR